MSEMDFERSWLGMALGGEWEPVPWKEKEGRVPVTELSARDLSCSDQLKPYWSAREEALSEETLGCWMLLACGREDGGI